MIASEPVDRIISRLQGVKRNGNGYIARCPAHDDKHQSLSVGEGNDGRALLKCFAGCSPVNVVSALGMKMDDLFVKETKRGNGHKPTNGNGGRGGGGRSIPPVTGATLQHPNTSTSTQAGCTLEEYAAAKGLPLDFLQRLGLTEVTYLGQPAIRVPYLDEGGSEAAVRFRINLRKSDEGDNRFRWRSGSKPTLYGLWRLQEARAAGYVALVEGESDAHTLWLHNIPALGVPGASSWKDEWAAHLDGIPTVYAVVEPDRGGETLRAKLGASSPLRERLRLVELGEAKDPSGLYLRDPATFPEAWQAALDTATPWTEIAQAEADAQAMSAWEACEWLANEPDILSLFAEVLAARGVVGESRAAKLVYLCLTSRVLDRPTSAVVKGPSSAGKSFIVERTLDFFPTSAYYALSAMSERALVYSEEPLQNRILVIYEAAGLSGDFASYLMRSLLSEGRVRYETVEKTSEGMRPRLIEREGPTGLLVTATAVHLHPENETRLLSIPISDTKHQTTRVLMALAEERSDEGDNDLAEWRALQEWIGGVGAERRVTIPFAAALAELTPGVAVRLRRDFGALLNLIRAHAILHQVTRERDEQGRIVASLEDYRAAYELVADLIAEGVEATVSDTIRETVQGVMALIQGGADTASVSQLATYLKMDRGSVSRRVRVCLDRGYLRNQETGRGKPYKLELGDTLPADQSILPTPQKLGEVLQCCSVAEGDIGTPLPPANLANADGLRGIRCPMKEGTVCFDCTPQTRCSYSKVYDQHEQPV